MIDVDRRTRLKRRFIRNTVVLAGSRATSMLLGVFTIPYIVRSIGAEEFGIWALVAVFTGYLGLTDLGMSTSFIRDIAYHRERGEHERISIIMSTGLAYYVLISGVVLVLGMTLTSVLIGWMRLEQPLHDTATFVLRVGLIGLVL